MIRTVLVVCVVLSAALSSATRAAAQDGVTLSGRLLNSLSGDPIPGVVVVIEELGRTTTSAADGTFSFEAVAPSTYHLFVVAPGFSSRRTEAQAGQPRDLLIDPELHFEEVVSVSAQARSQFEAFQPTSVLAGQELTQTLEMSLGATLENQPGMASRSFGPAPARPVVRGLDGDRVLILQDGQRLGDLSSQSGDHGVNVNLAAATRIEVVRGPATLLYGANAIGGLVNIITDEIPTAPEEGIGGNVTVDLGSAAREAAGAAELHVGNGTVALHVSGGGRRSGDVHTPAGPVGNSQSRNGFGSVGLSWTGARGYVGGSYGYDDTQYGIPVVEEGRLQLTPRRHAVTLRGGSESLEGVFDSVRATLGVRRYQHDEREGDEIGTSFTNHTTDVELMGSHRAIGRMKGSLGAWGLDRSFAAAGAEALSPPVDERGFAAFLYEEVTWPHVTVQFGGRLDHTRFTPQSASDPSRAFTNGSGSVGLLVRPAAADDRLTVAFSLAHAARNPALEELYFFGQHHGNFALEVGNPDLESETALGFDLSLRARGPRASAEVTYFRQRHSQLYLPPADGRRRVRGARRGVRRALRRARTGWAHARRGGTRGRGTRGRAGDRGVPGERRAAAGDRGTRRRAAHLAAQCRGRLGLRPRSAHERGVTAAADTAAAGPRRSAVSGERVPGWRRGAGHHDTASCGQRRGVDRGISAPQAVCVVLVRDGPDDQHGHGEARQRDRRAVPESSVAHQGARAGKGA